MREVLDFFIVGFGVAGASFTQKCIANNKGFKVFDAPQIRSASSIAAGVYNPVVLKRFNVIWDAQKQLEISRSTFTKIGSLINENILQDFSVLRVLSNEKETETWQKKAIKSNLKPYLDPNPITNTSAKIRAPYGLGVVQHTGRVDLELMLTGFLNHLESKGILERDAFDYSELVKNPNGTWTYKKQTAKNIVFTEGISALQNPHFPKKILHGNKGEVLHISTKENLGLNAIFKGACFLMPLIKPNTYYVGATYDRIFSSNSPTQENREKLENQLQRFLKEPYEVIGHYTNIRPTTPDNRPLVGEWKKGSGLYFINGMGSRGTLLAPRMAEHLYALLYQNKPLPSEVDITRFRTETPNFAI